MDRNALDWLLSTAPQTIAAFIGLIYAGASFVHGKFDDKISEDSTYEDILHEAKQQSYQTFKSILWLTFFTISIDLICLFLNPIENERKLSFSGTFDIYLSLAIIVIILNIFVVYKAISYMKKIMNPQYIDSTIKNLANKYNKGTIRAGLFLESFINFEKILREYHKDYNSPRPLTIVQMSRNLLYQNIINKKEFIDIMDINKLRNIIVHGGDIQMIEKSIDDNLKEITNNIIRRLNEPKSEITQ